MAMTARAMNAGFMALKSLKYVANPHAIAAEETIIATIEMKPMKNAAILLLKAFSTYSASAPSLGKREPSSA